MLKRGIGFSRLSSKMPTLFLSNASQLIRLARADVEVHLVLQHHIFFTFNNFVCDWSFSNCRSFTDIGFVRFPRSVFVEKWSWRWILRCAVTLPQWFCVVWTQSLLVIDGPYYSLFIFTDEVLSCVVFTVMIINTVELKTPNKWAIKVTDVPAYFKLILNTAQNIFHYRH